MHVKWPRKALMEISADQRDDEHLLLPMQKLHCCVASNHSRATCVGTGSGTGAGSTGTAQDASGWFLKWEMI